MPPLYMDIHEVPGVTTMLAAAEHVKDLAEQPRFGVSYPKYWVNEESGRIFCLCEAPNMEAAVAVHRAAHGVPADKIIEVSPELVDLFMGRATPDKDGAARLPVEAGGGVDNGLRTIVFTDIVGSTALTQRFGDDISLELVRLHDDVAGTAIDEFEGRKIKHTGDGVMAAFMSPTNALRFALRVQAGLAEAACKRPELPEVTIRIGAAIGQPVEHANDLFGATVQLAARLCAHAQPRQILVAAAVAEMCLGKGFKFSSVSELQLKGFDDAVYVRSLNTTPADGS